MSIKRHVSVTGSTNAELVALAETGERGPLWLRADRQTSGRGRLDRTWQSPPGNLHASLLISNRRGPVATSQLSLVMAVAVADVFPGVSLKWPNDIFRQIGEHWAKAGGILAQSGEAWETGGWAVIGVGLNLASAPDGLNRQVTTISDTVLSPGRTLDLLDSAFSRRLTAFDRDGFQPIAQAWTERAFGLGHQTSHGMALGLAPDGALRVLGKSGKEESVHAGDVIWESLCSSS